MPARTLRRLFLMAAFLTLPQVASAFEAGAVWTEITPAHRQKPVRVLITYPATGDGDLARLGADAVFTGVPVRRNATHADGRFPLVILSHGSGGNAASLGWLGARLAGEGFIVAAPNHTHTTSGDSIPSENFRMPERPKDISALIDKMLADPLWSRHIDADRIGAIGFSLGGASVLLAAGARASLDDYKAYCQTMHAPESDCAWFRRGGVDFNDIDRAAFEASGREGRIAAFVAVDPGFAPAWRSADLAGINIPALVINLGEGNAIPPAVRADALARQIPGADYATIPGAVHFSFLGTCTPEGGEVLKAYGEADPLCEDGGPVPREELHEHILSRITAFLRRNFGER